MSLVSRKVFSFLFFYPKHSEIIIEFAILIGISTHSYFYQKYEKKTAVNLENFFLIIWDFILVSFINDVISCLMKFLSLEENVSKKKRIMVSTLIPIVQLGLNSLIFSNLNVTGYTKTYLACMTMFLIDTCAKSIITYFKAKFVADLLRLIDTIWQVQIIVLCLTDPLINDENNPKLVSFYEVYFRYVEYHILVLALILMYNERNIDFDVSTKSYTSSAIIGKYDSYRFSVLLIFSHYYFILINGLGFDWKYFIGFSSIFVAFYTMNKYRQRKQLKMFISYFILMTWNLLSYLIALIYSSKEQKIKLF